jgi:hypothetical protein
MSSFKGYTPSRGYSGCIRSTSGFRGCANHARNAVTEFRRFFPTTAARAKRGPACGCSPHGPDIGITLNAMATASSTGVPFTTGNASRAASVGENPNDKIASYALRGQGYADWKAQSKVEYTTGMGKRHNTHSRNCRCTSSLRLNIRRTQPQPRLHGQRQGRHSNWRKLKDIKNDFPKSQEQRLKTRWKHVQIGHECNLVQDATLHPL